MTINYTYTINSTNFPSSQDFYWEVISNSGGANPGTVSSDFDVSSGGPVACTGNTTTFQIGVKEQTGTQGTRDFTLRVGTNSGFTGTVVTLNFQVTDGAPAAPTYDITGLNSVTEPTLGNAFDFTSLNLLSGTGGATDITQNVDINDTMDVTIAAANATNVSVSVSGTSTGISVSPTTADISQTPPDFVVDFANATSGTYALTFSDGGAAADNGVIQGNVTAYSGTTYTVSGSNITDGTYYWEAEGTGGSAATGANFLSGYNDGSGTLTTIVSNKLRGQVAVSSNSGTFVVKLDNDAASGNKTFKLNLYSDSGYSTLVKDGSTTTVGTITITDNPPGYSQITSSPSPANINEGDVVTITVNTSGVPDDTGWGWELDGTSTISNNEWQYSSNNSVWFDGTSTGYAASSNGIFKINSNTGTLYIRPKADTFTDGATETIVVKLRQFDTNGTSTYVSGSPNTLTINVSDTSQTPVTPATVDFYDIDGTTLLAAPPTNVRSEAENANPGTGYPITLQAGLKINRDGKIYFYGAGSHTANWVSDINDMNINGGNNAATSFEFRVVTISTSGGTAGTDWTVVGPRGSSNWTTIPDTAAGTSFGMLKTVNNLTDFGPYEEVVELQIRQKTDTNNNDTIRATFELSATSS